MSDIEPVMEKAPQMGGSGSNAGQITLQQAVQMGAYDPEDLAHYEEWHGLSTIVQFELIRRGIDNRRKQLRQQWAAMANAPDFSQKPHLKEAQKNIELAQKQLQIDEEELTLEYSRMI
jgi:hypothetical protein